MVTRPDIAGLPVLASRGRLLAGVSLLGLAAGGALLPGAAQAADTPTSFTVASGAWSNPADWNNGAPNGGSATTVDNGGTANTDGGNATDTLTIGSTSTVDITDNTSLTIGSAIVNHGNLNLSSAGNQTSLVIADNASVTLSGGGKVSLNNSASNLIYVNNGNGLLTNVDNTIQGSGNIGIDRLNIDNQAAGLIDANQSTQLILQTNGSGGTTNEGTLRASNGGQLNIAGSFVTQTGAGHILATGAGSTVLLNSATINGGSLTTTAGGAIATQAGTTNVANGVTVTSGSTLTTSDNSTLLISGTINNQGNIALASGGNTTSLQLQDSGSATLIGGGTVSLNNNAANRIFVNNSNGLLTNVNNIIQGVGNIGIGRLNVDNQAAGLIDANISGGTLVVQDQGNTTNEGTLRASNGGNLLVLNSTVTQNGGTILATGTSGSNASTVQLQNTTINTGTLTSTGGGVLTTVAGNNTTLNNVTISKGSTLNVADNSTLLLAGSLAAPGTTVNHGTIALGSGGNTTSLQLFDSSNQTLTGGGVVSLSNNAANRIFVNNSDATLTNADNIIQGSGNIGIGRLNIDNQAAGLIDANQSTALVLQTNTGTTNEGTLRASNGGQLNIYGSSVTQTAGGNILATGAGSNVLLTNTTINGGPLTTTAGGSITTTGTNTLNGVTVTAGSTVTTNDNTTTYLAGTIVNKGNLALSSGGNTTELRVGGGQTVTLTGGGTVSLSNAAPNYIRDADQATGVLINKDNTIQGSGNIGNGQLQLDNQSAGVINANQSTQLILQTNGAGATNEGLIEATNGSQLNISGSAVTQSGNGVIQAAGAGSNVLLNNTTINGGPLTTSAGGSFTTTGTNTLNGVTVTAGSTVTTNDNTTTYLAGTIVNKGNLALSSGGNTTELRVGGGQTVTLTGGGTVSLSNAAPNYIRDANQATGVLINKDNTIQGSGNIGNGQLQLDNQSAGVINANQSTQLILQTNGAGATNEGLIEATNGSQLNISGSAVTQSGNGVIQAAGAGSNVLLNNTTINGGPLTTSAGGSITTTGTNTLNGVTVTAGSTVTTNDNTTTYLAGTIVNKGNLALSSGGNATELRVGGGQTVTLTGGGTVSLSNAAPNYIRDANQATGSLNNQDNKIQGAGQFGNGQLGIVNGGAGSIVANVSNALNINTNSLGLTNDGLLQATAGATLNVGANDLNNFSSGTLTNGQYEADAGSTLNLNTGAIVTDAAGIILSGAGSSITTSAGPIETTLTTIAAGGALNVLAARNYTTTNDIGNSGVILLGGGNFAPNSVTNTATGLLTGFGTVTQANGGPVANAGTVSSSSGTLSVTGGISGQGTVGSAAGSTLDLSAAPRDSTAGLFSVSGNVALGSHNVIVSSDYHNFNFGVGNGFNAHANVTGTGKILATGDVGLGISGADVSNGKSSTPTLALGNVHVTGSGNTSFTVDNTGTTGPSLRGAVQNGASSPGLVVTAQNFGPVAPGASSAAQTVGFNAGSAGAINGSFKVVSNFDNVASLTVGVTASAYDFANPTVNTTQPVNVGNFHVGSAPAQAAVSVSNATISDAAFQEGLDASTGAATGAATSNAGSFSLLAAGGTNASAIKVGVNGTTAGVETGMVALNLVSDGASTSHLGTTTLASQNVSVTGTGYNLASSNTIAPISFGVLHTNTGTHTEALTVSNTAPTGAYSEGLDSSFGGYTNKGGLNVTASGSITNLAAGATDASSLVLSLSTATAGMVNGTILVHQASNGTIDGLGNTALADQNPGVSGTVQATVTNLATPQINNAPINVGNVRIGSAAPTQGVSVTNTAPAGGFSESLIGNVTGTTGTGITAAGGFGPPSANPEVAPQGTDARSIQVGIDTASAGAKAGSAVIDFKSDGTAFQGGTVTDLGNTSVAVTGAVYRLASPTLNTPNVTLAARVGDAAPTASVSVSNTSPDQYTEGLNAGFGTAVAGFATSGSVANLAATLTDMASLGIKLNTATSGSFGGTQQVAFASTGVGTDNATDLALAPGNVTVAGHVYQAATASVSPNPVAFGTVHVGDAGLSRSVSVGNTASGALVDTLTGGFGSVSGPFTGSGALTVAAGSSGSLSVGLNTATAGVFNGSANLALTSHDGELTDAAVAAGPVGLTATVNNYAKAGLGQVAGSGVLSAAATVYTLDFGSVAQGSGSLSDNLFVANIASGPADLLSGMFTIASGGGDFGLAGFATGFSDLAAGSYFNGLDVSFDTSATGMFTETLNLQGVGSNDSGYNSAASIDPITLIIDGTVTAGGGGGNPVPEPSGLAVLGVALLGMLGLRRRAG